MTDEREIISQLKNPKTQRAAFGLIVRQYSEQLYWLIRRMVLTHDDANDVMQNVFLKASLEPSRQLSGRFEDYHLAFAYRHQ